MKNIYFLGFLFVFVVLFSVFYVGSVFACTYQSYQQCIGNQLYWYDSCGNQGNYIGSCQNNNNNYNSYGACTYHAYKNCVGNSIYWYDSCGTQQDLYFSCGGQTCQYGQCTAYIQPPIVYTPVQSTYVAYYRTACNGSKVSWYDSLGAVSGLYRNCSDANSCTQDTCSARKCSNTLKCDGTTCATGSADYNKYCQTNQPVVPAASKITSNLSVSFFAKQDVNSSQWQKSAQIVSNGNIYFMISVVNNATAQADNVTISSNIPSEVSSLGNLKVNGVAVTGDIVAGVNIGSIAPSSAKSITFEGKTQVISATATKQATATSIVSGATQSDTVSLNLVAGQAVGAAVAAAPTTTGFMAFLKRWYVWIIVGLVLLFLFIIVFRRLSSNE